MGKLIYFNLTSLDGRIGGEGDYDWSAPSDDAMTFINDLVRPMGTYLYGRKTYETMAVWETPEALPSPTPADLEFGSIWQAADKVVHSRSLGSVSTARTRLEREFDPEAVRDLKARSGRDVSVGGPTLAAHAIRAGLVDEIHLLVVPTLLGRGIPVFAADTFVPLELLEERRFANGWVYLRHRARA